MSSVVSISIQIFPFFGRAASRLIPLLRLLGQSLQDLVGLVNFIEEILVNCGGKDFAKL
jgi:hypothetical protein